MEDDLLQFMENVLIDEKKEEVCIVIDIMNMIEENENVIIQVNIGDIVLKKIVFGKEVKNEKNE